MDTQMLLTIIIPVMLIIIMGGIGLTLTKADFLRVKQMPFAIFAMLFVQIVIIPIFAVFLSWVFNLSPFLSAGMMLLASTPGGPSASIYSHLAKGNVVLNVTLTALNSLIGIISVPIVSLIAVKMYLQSSTTVPPQTSKLLQIVFIILVPMIIGMLINSKKPDLAKKLSKHVSKITVIFILMLIAYGFIKEFENMKSGFIQVGLVVLIFNIGNLILGYLTGVALKLNRQDKISSTMELGIHNCVLALGIAMNPDLFNSVEMAMPAAVYSILMNLTGSASAYWFAKKH